MSCDQVARFGWTIVAGTLRGGAVWARQRRSSWLSSLPRPPWRPKQLTTRPSEAIFLGQIILLLRSGVLWARSCSGSANRRSWASCLPASCSARRSWARSGRRPSTRSSRPCRTEEHDRRRLAARHPHAAAAHRHGDRPVAWSGRRGRAAFSVSVAGIVDPVRLRLRAGRVPARGDAAASRTCA